MGPECDGPHPLKRVGGARELLGAVCWLLDDDAAGFVTDVTLPVDSGFLSLRAFERALDVPWS